MMEILGPAVLVFTYQLSLTNAFSTTAAGTLEDILTSGYHTMVRPSSSINISIEFGMYQINELNNVDQTLSVTGVLVMLWNDPRLTWDTSTYGGMDRTYLRDDQIWVPPLVFANSAEDINILGDNPDTKSTPLYISNTGVVVWLAATSCLLSCTVDITYYPFDEQKCDIKVSAWMYTIGEVQLVPQDTGYINLELYEENGEWGITKTEATFGTRSMHGHSMSEATFSIYLARKHSYYIFNIILPVVFISFLGCLVFLLPVESGEKNGFSLTILLSLTVVLTIVSDKIPTTSINLCVMSVYLLCTVMLSGLEVLVTVVIQRIHIQTEHGHKLGDTMKRSTRSLAKMLCYRIKKYGDSKETKIAKRPIATPKPETPRKNKVAPKTPPIVGNYVQFEDTNENYEYEDLANILDKLFFIVFFFITVIVTVTFQIILSLK